MGKLQGVDIDEDSEQEPELRSQARGWDVFKYVQALPKFDEKDVEAFFILFEKVAKQMKWPQDMWVLLIQTKLVGRASEVFASLSEVISGQSDEVKKSILGACELVPELYRQRFRSLRREPGQTYLEFERLKQINFDKWIRALKIDQMYDALRKIIVLEDLKSSLLDIVRSHVEEQRVKTARSAAEMTDGLNEFMNLSLISDNSFSR